MDLDIEVQKLKLLKANHLSQRYALEDQLIRKYPEAISALQQRINGFQSDMELLKKGTIPNADGFCPMTIQGRTYTEKKAAGTALLEVCNSMTSPDPISIGSYRGFQMSLSYDSFDKAFKVSLEGALTHVATLGTDVFGNIQRMDNVLDSMSEKSANCVEKLENLKLQAENARQEIAQPFPREAELKAKSARLDELNILLNMDKRENEIVDGERDSEENQPNRGSRERER